MGDWVISSLAFIQIVQSTLDTTFYNKLTAFEFKSLAYCVLHYRL